MLHWRATFVIALGFTLQAEDQPPAAAEGAPAKQTEQSSAQPAKKRTARRKLRVRRRAKLAKAQVQSLAAEKPPTPGQITSEQLSGVQKGISKDQLMAKLGQPQFVSGVMGLEDGARETLTYLLGPEQPVTVRVVDGKVQSIEK